MATLLQGIRYAFRQLLNHPGFALTAILSLALGIRATVSVFSVGLGVLLGLALSRLMPRWVQHASAIPILFLGVSFLLLVVAALACLVPARRASAVDPMAALQCE